MSNYISEKRRYLVQSGNISNNVPLECVICREKGLKGHDKLYIINGKNYCYSHMTALSYAMGNEYSDQFQIKENK